MVVCVFVFACNFFSFFWVFFLGGGRLLIICLFVCFFRLCVVFVLFDTFLVLDFVWFILICLVSSGVVFVLFYSCFVLVWVCIGFWSCFSSGGWCVCFFCSFFFPVAVLLSWPGLPLCPVERRRGWLRSLLRLRFRIHMRRSSTDSFSEHISRNRGWISFRTKYYIYYPAVAFLFRPER